MPLWDLLVVQVLTALGLGVALVWGLSTWYCAAAGLALGLLLVVRVRGMSLRRWTFLRWALWRGSRHRTDRNQSESEQPDLFEPFDAELPDGSQIGFRWDGKTLMSLVRIADNPQAITIMEPAMTVSGETVSMPMLADSLRQFDISIDSIDVISQGCRSRGHNHIAAVYDAVLGPLPAIAHRSVWVAVRLDPTSCPEAIRRRGGGWEGIVRTAATATRRVANHLTDAGLRPQILSSSEIASATSQLSDGVGLTTVDETWSTCQKGRFQLTSFGVMPELFTTAGLGSLWTVPSHSTTVCISLRRDGRDDVLKLRGLVRFDGYGRNPVRLRGLTKLPGQQLAALTCSLPVPPPRRPVGGWVFGEGDRAIDELVLPASGCGQVIGADEYGRAVALPVFGPKIRRVEMCGTLQLAQQVVLRSLALGARIRVHTRRTEAWQVMVHQVADHDLLTVADRNRPAMQAGSSGNYSVEVFDGIPEHPVRAGVTTVIVNPTNSVPSSECDVTLQLVDADRDAVQVGTRAGTALVTMVATDDEMRYLAPPFNLAD
jgi:type VII secretion protein EccE